MATHRDAHFPGKPYIEPAPLSAEHGGGKVQEVGVSSAPLQSASFFLGGFCQKYNEDFMLCKSENRDPAHCLTEGRRVTRCAQDFFKKLGEACGKEWEAHWECLENNNQELYACRKPERALNKCVFDKLKLSKTIPGTPEGQPQVHEKPKPIFRGSHTV